MKRDKIKLISAMTILGTISIVRRNIPYASSVVSLVRGLIGCLFLLLLRLVQKKPMNLPNIRKNFFLLFVSGALLGINWIVLFEAYRYTTVAIATVCNYMAPVFVMAASPVLLHEKLTVKKCLCVAVALVGMLMVSGVQTASVTDIKRPPTKVGGLFIWSECHEEICQTPVISMACKQSVKHFGPNENWNRQRRPLLGSELKATQTPAIFLKSVLTANDH